MLEMWCRIHRPGVLCREGRWRSYCQVDTAGGGPCQERNTPDQSPCALPGKVLDHPPDTTRNASLQRIKVQLLQTFARPPSWILSHISCQNCFWVGTSDPILSNCEIWWRYLKPPPRC